MIYSLHDLSRDLKKLRCRSDLFENKQLSLPRMASVVQRDGDSSILESDLEYDESSEDEKRSNKSTPYFGHDSARMLLIDNMEPYEEQIKKAGQQTKRKRKMEKLPDTIQEENCESEFPPDTNPIGTSSFLSSRSCHPAPENPHRSRLHHQAYEVLLFLPIF